MHRRKEINLISWKPPSEGWVKLNSEGARNNNGREGCVGIIRGSEGSG